MFREYFLLLILGHIVGDFYIQTEYMAYKKREDKKKLLLHGLLYWLSMLFVSLPVISLPIVLFATIASVLHFSIDYLKYIYISVQKKKGCFTARIEQNVFFTDQVLHVLGLIIIAYSFISSNYTFCVNYFTKSLLLTTGLSAKNLLNWLVVLLAIHKPANIIISQFLMSFRPANKNKKGGENRKAGKYIGTLERIIILLFISLKQYSAIGLVLTAKSIARYDRITKDASFAEYYLLGTLLSTLSAVVMSFTL
ncbi:MAG: DUF3307 domain-containing protein [Clostridiaceae bacterium]|mgnify:CR=1 FL=1|nr:DUF3307 domain-containing protein [Clostridiaceae bacterium]